MEINMNINRIRSQSLDDDDNFSAHSHNSSGFFNSLNSANNSDSECSGPVSVRDMVQRYNKQFQKTQTSPANYKIKHRYATAHRHHSQHQLAATKSSFCGLNNYGSQTNHKQVNDQLNEAKITIPLNNHEQYKNTCCQNCTARMCCQNRSLKNCITTTKMIPTSVVPAPMLLQANNENNQNSYNNLNFHCNSCGCGGRGSNGINNCCNKINAKDILAAENCNRVDDTTIETNKLNNVTNAGVMEELNKKDFTVGLHRDNLQRRNSQLLVEQKNNHLLSTDSVEVETKHLQQQQQQPTEACYQSKTTIAKTSSGVRIIIDIFFDQEQCTTNNAIDIVGSRVETDIPQSRILTEFQQQIMTKNKSNIALVDTNTYVTPASAAAAASAAVVLATSSATSLNRG